MGFFTFIAEARRAMEESSAVAALKKFRDSDELYQFNRTVHNMIQHLNNSELAITLKRIRMLDQHLTQSVVS
ncbi:MAG: hypothetical protein TH68_07760 [Candidatus Synechococcus spongiarum 142]|uniref:Uncharacterized protein n=1 Tax=Candidatus Synechococcus spongiarum 142 TaxID=1608213 RepID=A0A6N3X2G1_9SYNE|nr:MAG: hypothetical protein TH68_07760 [Candidatus Synechococcus spongiarum 142]